MNSDWTTHLLPLRDGRRLEVLDHGTGRPLVLMSGTPGAAVPDAEFAELARRHGLRLLQPHRPGYGRSSPSPRRRVIDVVADLDQVLDHLGIDDVLCAGVSGGGPHALAAAAGVRRCRAAAVLVSPAPRDADDLDFYRGMGASNREEWQMAEQGEGALRPWLADAAAGLLAARGSFLGQFSDAVSEPDRAILAAEDGAMRHARLAKALERGIEGWLEDDLALTTPWGFAPEAVCRPVTFWTGAEDRFVSPDHSVWLSRRTPGADLHVYAGEGHLSLRAHHMDAVLTDLLDRAGRAGWPGSDTKPALACSSRTSAPSRRDLP